MFNFSLPILNKDLKKWSKNFQDSEIFGFWEQNEPNAIFYVVLYQGHFIRLLKKKYFLRNRYQCLNNIQNKND